MRVQGLADGHRSQRAWRLDREPFGHPSAAVGAIEGHRAPESHRGELPGIRAYVTVDGHVDAGGVGDSEPKRPERYAIADPVGLGTPLRRVLAQDRVHRDDEWMHGLDVVEVDVE